MTMRTRIRWLSFHATLKVAAISQGQTITKGVVTPCGQPVEASQSPVPPDSKPSVNMREHGVREKIGNPPSSPATKAFKPTIATSRPLWGMVAVPSSTGAAGLETLTTCTAVGQ